jgi:ribosomal protein S18 acetylase RimI-like enzyme
MHSMKPWRSAVWTLTEDLALRHVQAQDQAFIDDLYATTREDLQALGCEASALTQLIRMQQQLQTMGYQQMYPQATYWLLTQHTQPIGRLVINQTPSEIRLVDWALVPQARGQGVGLLLLHKLQEMASQEACALHLSVRKDNSAAHRLYYRAGFSTWREDALFEHRQWLPAQSPAALMPQG